MKNTSYLIIIFTILISNIVYSQTFEIGDMAFPISDGDSGQVPTTDGSGNITWKDGQKGIDYSSYFDYTCDDPQEYILDIHGSNDSTQDHCGTLYDTGGATGPYDDNEEFEFSIHLPEEVIQTRLIIQSMDIESGDTLYIHNYKINNSTSHADTLYFSNLDIIEISFSSDNNNNGSNFDGFQLDWAYLEYVGIDNSVSEEIGFFFNAEKQAIGGGIDTDEQWQNIGVRAVNFGIGNSASGEKSISIGNLNTNEGLSNIGIGDKNITSDLWTTAIGVENEALSEASTAIGYVNKTTGSKETALGYKNETSGGGSVAIGLLNEAIGEESIAIGSINDADGTKSSAIGYNNNIDGTQSSAFGYFNEINASNASAFGRTNNNSGDNSTTVGYNNGATANNSTAIGYNTSATIFQMTALGTYNEELTGSATAWVSTDPLLVIGNGEKSFSASNAVTILKNGDVGIGVDDPDEALHVNGKIKFGLTETIEDFGHRIMGLNSTVVPTSDNARDLGSSSLRWRRLYAANGTINTSDIRSKTNVKELRYGIKEIMLLKPVSYQWKAKSNDGSKLGLIAQDLLEVLPEVVQTHDWQLLDETNEDKMERVELERYGVYYSDIIPVLVKGIQEQQEQIKKLTTRLKRLETEQSKS